MPDDEPLDDARAVGMAAAAAAAKVVETAARAAADQRDRQPRLPDRGQSSQRTAQQPYDSARRRAEADTTMKAAGVADEPRTARTVSDLLNGADPATAAASGKANKAGRVGAGPAKQRTPEQARTR